MSLEIISKLSNFYGADPKFVLAGGGNTSIKDEQNLWVKPSGVTLADINPDQYVKMNREAIRKVFALSSWNSDEEREAVVKKIMADAVCFDSSGRPSVEAPLHERINTKYVVHLHPAMVNGMSCGVDGQAKCAELFPDSLWVEFVDPGFCLAAALDKRMSEYAEKNGCEPEVIFLENHGVFVGGDTEAEIMGRYDLIMQKLLEYYTTAEIATEISFGEKCLDTVFEAGPQLRSLLGDESASVAVTSLPPFDVFEGPLTPDHIVYAKSYALICDQVSPEAVARFEAVHGYKPKVVSIPGKAVFCVGAAYKDALTTAELTKDATLVRQLVEAFGGVRYMSDRNREFIENWEVESYRKKVASAAGGSGPLDGKIAVITGGAQGFGYGIAEELIKAGAVAAIADLNFGGAQDAAFKLCDTFGKNKAFALEVNISNEESVENMTRSLVEICGGCDLFVANAGVLKAGSVKEMDKKDWDFVTNVNYSGYFLCTKHISRIMSSQNQHSKNWSDIIQVNSKSGLAGSNRNGAYAGSKFGTIGLTQSFAMELVDDHIKVNSVCPGNFFDGPLWSNPENGLFVQYLKSNKVPGATCIEDVKAFYEKKIPMARGCFPADVAKAIIYAVSQQYETGQAIPVTGGQVMLN
jgi:NAD(P)-dependent dehydrogenase (short-subunit alcohol dehydrogenase family)/rhamnose utilization protein RhaD (predicted bifunctional aldolase and dehydrogenase)